MPHERFLFINRPFLVCICWLCVTYQRLHNYVTSSSKFLHILSQSSIINADLQRCQSEPDAPQQPTEERRVGQNSIGRSRFATAPSQQSSIQIANWLLTFYASLANLYCLWMRIYGVGCYFPEPLYRRPPPPPYSQLKLMMNAKRTYAGYGWWWKQRVDFRWLDRTWYWVRTLLRTLKLQSVSEGSLPNNFAPFIRNNTVEHNNCFCNNKAGSLEGDWITHLIL